MSQGMLRGAMAARRKPAHMTRLPRKAVIRAPSLCWRYPPAMFPAAKMPMMRVKGRLEAAVERPYSSFT